MQAGCGIGGLLASIVPTELYGQPLGLAQAPLALSLGSVFGLVALLALVGIGILILRRRRKSLPGRHAYTDPPLVFPIPRTQSRRPAGFPGAEELPGTSPRAATPPRPLVPLPAAAHAPPATVPSPVEDPQPLEVHTPVIAPPPEIPPLTSDDHVAGRETEQRGGSTPLRRVRKNGAARPPETFAPAAEAALPPSESAGVPPGAATAPTANGGEYVEGRTVRYYRPLDDTVQFLPGRLEIVEGEDRGQDIRFVRTWGAVPEITFGRSAGPAQRHVQLHARTVSREHARLRYEEDGWQIGNLSRTNPVVVNGEELHSVEDTRALTDGDLIEMGEVVFRFRER